MPSLPHTSSSSYDAPIHWWPTMDALHNINTIVLLGYTCISYCTYIHCYLHLLYFIYNVHHVYSYLPIYPLSIYLFMYLIHEFFKIKCNWKKFIGDNVCMKESNSCCRRRREENRSVFVMSISFLIVVGIEGKASPYHYWLWNHSVCLLCVSKWGHFNRRRIHHFWSVELLWEWCMDNFPVVYVSWLVVPQTIVWSTLVSGRMELLQGLQCEFSRHCVSL